MVYPVKGLRRFKFKFNLKHSQEMIELNCSPAAHQPELMQLGVGGLVKNRTTWDWLIRERGATRWLLSQIVGQTLVKRAQCNAEMSFRCLTAIYLYGKFSDKENPGQA